MQLVRECMAAECAMLSAQLILQRYIWRRKQHLLRAVEVLKRLVSVTFVSSTQFLLLHACSLVTLSFAPPLHKRKSVFFFFARLKLFFILFFFFQPRVSDQDPFIFGPLGERSARSAADAAFACTHV